MPQANLHTHTHTDQSLGSISWKRPQKKQSVLNHLLFLKRNNHYDLQDGQRRQWTDPRVGRPADSWRKQSCRGGSGDVCALLEERTRGTRSIRGNRMHSLNQLPANPVAQSRILICITARVGIPVFPPLSSPLRGCLRHLRFH